MLKKALFFALMLTALLVLAGQIAAQEITPEPTAEVMVTVATEATSVTVTPSAEATIESTAEATAEATLEPGALLNFPGAGSYTVRQQYSDGDRSYRVYIPLSYDASADPLPLLIIMHGAGGTGAGTESFTGFDDLADTDNFVVVFPDGLNNVWNDGRVGDPRISNVDDVRFIDNIITFVSGGLNIDANRIYAGGYSMGGMMSYRLGCEMSSRFAAIASVASTMPAYLIQTCTDTDPIPLIVFQGTDDPVVPWTGVQGGYLSAAQTIGFWGNHNGCTPDFDLEMLPDGATNDYTRVVRQQLSGCAADVTLYGIYFGGHTWPGHPINTTFSLGGTSLDIDATQLMWEFFRDHPKAAAN